ncbi:hypothetical protein [Nocardia brasiliensis]|uniref:hypothetical protein n=1 Tax=Nocardia brasiliensis TaxID=37326 RepID=UPI003672BDDC
MVDDVRCEVERRYPEQLAAQGELDRAVVKSGGWGREEAVLGPEGGLRGPAVTLSGIEVDTAVVYVDVIDLGTFTSDAQPLGVMVYVWADHSDGGVLPDTESEGWARAVLGTRRSDCSYAVRSSGGDLRWRQGYLVVVDDEGQPIEIPNDFYFPGATNGSGDIFVRPLRLTSDGKIATEYVAAAARGATLYWPVELIGAGPEDARSAAEALLNELRVKGSVDTRFRLLAMRLDGTTAGIVFRRLDTGEELQHKVQLPGKDDLSEGSDYFRRSTPRLPQPFTSPEEWAQFMCGFLQELFRTGFLGRVE